MTQEEKDLLLKDLCARLPYNTIVHGVYAHQNQDFDTESDYIAYKEMDNILTVLDIEWIQMCAAEVKPYLFPLSNMTDEQSKELEKLCDMYTPDDDYDPYACLGIEVLYKHILDDGYKFNFKTDVIDWLNKNHFDYRGLIPMGLAIDCTNLNIY